jgi:hypothetical protein
VLLVNADADEVVPKECTLRLREAMGGPELRWIRGGHYALVMQLGPAIQDIAAHLHARTAW